MTGRQERGSRGKNEPFHRGFIFILKGLGQERKGLNKRMKRRILLSKMVFFSKLMRCF